MGVGGVVGWVCGSSVDNLLIHSSSTRLTSCIPPTTSKITQSAPLSITLGDGVVSIRAENAFALHRNMVPTGDDDDAAAAKQHKRKSRILAGFKLPSASHHHHHHQHHHHHHHHHHHKGGAGGKGGDDRGALEPQQQDGAEEGGEGKGELTLLTVIEVRTQRRLRAGVAACPTRPI